MKPIQAALYYHLTPSVNIPSIWRHGILPAVANSIWKVSWYTDPFYLEGAVLHVAKRKDIEEQEIAVCVVRALPGLFARSMRYQFRWTSEVLRPCQYLTVNEARNEATRL